MPASPPPPSSRGASWDHSAYLGLVASSATGGRVSKRVGPGRERETVGIQGEAGAEMEGNAGGGGGGGRKR